MLVVAQAAEEAEKDCTFNVNLGECEFEGTIPGEEPPPVNEPVTRQPVVAPPNQPYFRITGGCWRWTENPPGIDSRDAFNEQRILESIATIPRCVGEPLPDRAWRIFRSFPLAEPAPSFQPAEHGITGLPTYLASPNPSPINYAEPLPDGRLLEVRAQVTALTVDWGDGVTSSNLPTVAVPWPDGAFTHTYTTKTCPPDYRVSHPSGGLCHPTLEAYPVTATYTWWGQYRAGGAWIPIGTLDLTTAVAYDVDEVIGVLVNP